MNASLPSRIGAFALLAVAALGLPATAGATDGVQSVAVPAEGRAVDASHPSRVVGRGTPASCTSRAVVAAVRAGGVIRFDCGPQPVVIHMAQTARVVNRSLRVVLDGGGLVTLSGDRRRRILYMNTCDPKQVWTTSHCQDQSTPQLVVQNLTFADGNSTGEKRRPGRRRRDLRAGRAGRIVNATFLRNRCDATGPDMGGGAVRVLSQYRNQPVYVVGSRFSGGVCSNGAALSSIGVSWVVLNSRFTGNRAIGSGANPQRAGTPGGGSGGGIYNDGNTFTLRIAGTLMQDNHANEGGGAIFYVSNDRSGTLAIDRSTLRRNPSEGFRTLPGIFFLGAKRTITRSVVR